MANKVKEGLDYWPFETGLFGDRKIARLSSFFGSKGFLIYIYIVNECYKDKGYFLKWDEDAAFDIARGILGLGIDNITEQTVNEVVSYCMSDKVGLFNKELYHSENIITSKGIQERYEKIIKDAKRKTKINKKYSLLNDDSEEMPIDSEEINKSSEEMPIDSEEKTQRKGKYSKGKYNAEESENSELIFVKNLEDVSRQIKSIKSINQPERLIKKLYLLRDGPTYEKTNLPKSQKIAGKVSDEDIAKCFEMISDKEWKHKWENYLLALDFIRHPYLQNINFQNGIDHDTNEIEHKNWKDL